MPTCIRSSCGIVTSLCVVPTPSVTVTAPNSQTVGQSLTLECNVTAVRGITSDGDIIWTRGGMELQRTELNFTEDMDTDTNNYTISQLNTTDDGREYQCEVVINTSTPVMANGSVALDVMGE